MAKISKEEMAKALRANVVTISSLTKKESEQYQPLGSPVILPIGDKLDIYYYGSRMLSSYKKSLDDVVGYRIVGQDEEIEFREDCGNKYGIVVKYYGKL